jgi:hypothetical protein
VETQLCAYNSAFAELGLRFRWDAHTLAWLTTISGEPARIAAYIEANHAHLLKAYSLEFLSQAILERKSARCPTCLPMRVESAAGASKPSHPPRADSQWIQSSRDSDLPALAGV